MTYALVNSNGNITEIGETREEFDGRWGHNRELVELVFEHQVGDRIDYNERGIEIATNLEPG